MAAADSASTPAIELDGIVKTFGRTTALDGLSLTVGRGELVGLLGPNGAGKTPGRAELLGRFRLESPHNQLIGIAAEIGLPALAAFVIFLAACVSACVRRARVGDGRSRSIALVVLAALASNFVVYFFKTPDVTTSEVLWITLGAGLAAMGNGRMHGLEPHVGSTAAGS